jgi:hypothetical protein
MQTSQASVDTTFSIATLGINYSHHLVLLFWVSFLLNVVMLSVLLLYCHAKCRYTECRYADCHGARLAPVLALSYQNYNQAWLAEPRHSV